MKLELLTNQELEKIVATPFNEAPLLTEGFHKIMKVMAMEILEYRRAYGPLGCDYLEY